MIEQLPIEERWKRVCLSNMELRGGLLDIITLCDAIAKGEKEYNSIENLIIDIKAIAKGTLK